MNANPPSARGVMSAHSQGAEYNSPEHAAIIASSQERSRGFGLTSANAPDYSGTSTHAVNALLEENHFLFQHAAPVMETLYQQIANTHSMVLLTTRTGTILHSLGDTDFLEKASQIALAPGVDWSEKSKGTNAIGTALAEGQALVVHGSQHYLQANQFLTCSCTPILDPHGDVIGALDVTGDYRSYHQHTMALARMSAQMIENHMFADVFRRRFAFIFTRAPNSSAPSSKALRSSRQMGAFCQPIEAHSFNLACPPIHCALILFHPYLALGSLNFLTKRAVPTVNISDCVCMMG